MTPSLQPAIAITTLLLLLQLFHLPTLTASPAYIMDEDGKPMLNGGTYYILPQTTANGGGLTAAPKSQSSPCPLYMAQEKDNSSNGQPFKITSPINSKYLPFGPTEFFLVDATTTCTEPLVWRLITDDATGHVYVAAGGATPLLGSSSAFSLVMPFNYDQPWNYQINYCDNVVCGAAGLYENNGLLGIADGFRIAVRFRKASTQTSQFM